MKLMINFPLIVFQLIQTFTDGYTLIKVDEWSRLRAVTH